MKGGKLLVLVFIDFSLDFTNLFLKQLPYDAVEPIIFLIGLFVKPKILFHEFKIFVFDCAGLG
jgi:hypothetical protein